MFSVRRNLSAFDPNMVVHHEPGFVTKTLRALNMKTVKEIMQELKAVDDNSDGRLDTGELKNLLRKHKSAFTDEEISQIGELFYAGKSGGSVSFDKFIEAIDRVIQKEEGEDDEEGRKENPLDIGTCGNEYLFYKSHSNMDWNIELTHTAPKNLRDRLAYNAVKVVRFVFDFTTGWNGEITTNKILNRTIFLETIAAVPGMVAAIVRHFKSLRTFQRDGGMMQMFLDEANNERMHLLTFVRMKDPNFLFRLAVIGGQLGFGSAFLAAYLISPKFCHRFVGYVEEEACSTYTKIIHAIENAEEGTDLATWRTRRAPRIARSYWKLGEEGTVLQLIYAVRADEAEHRDVNHLCSSMEDGMQNPVSNTEEHLNTMLLKYVRDIMDQTKDNSQKDTASA
ncbi:hypothetical protein ACA910_002644 [Epithemia clementina (nom. ined.)]